IWVNFTTDAKLISVNAQNRVVLTGSGSLLDFDNDDAPVGNWNILTRDLTLDVAGSIGATGAFLETALGGTLTATAGGNQYLHEVSGDLRLATVSTDPNPLDAIATDNTAFIAASNGRILNGLSSGFNVISGKVWLLARNDIGSSTLALSTKVGKLQGE